MAIFFMVILIIPIILTILITCSTLKIEIQELEIIGKRIIKLKLIISLALFNKIKWIKLRIDKEKMEKARKNIKIQIINKLLDTKILKDYENIRKITLKNWKKILENWRNVEIENIAIKAKIGTQNPCVTAYLVAIISSFLPIALFRKISNPRYKIEPVYIEKNYIYLSINCIIALKLVHIINIIKELKGKEVYQKYGRTSNRRAYGNSNG